MPSSCSEIIVIVSPMAIVAFLERRKEDRSPCSNAHVGWFSIMEIIWIRIITDITEIIPICCPTNNLFVVPPAPTEPEAIEKERIFLSGG